MEERKRIPRPPFPFYSCFLSTCLFCICATTLLLHTRKASLEETSTHIEQVISSGCCSSQSQGKDSNMMLNRRHLNGLGSYPPRCKAKCGSCTPCKPVHVPVPPGSSAPTEYYPEAWRCKCGNKLYMP